MTNCLVESVKVFHEIVNEKLLGKQFYLVFNNMSMFQESLKTKPLENYVMDYNGSSVHDALQFVVQLFLKLVRQKEKVIPIVTELTDCAKMKQFISEIIHYEIYGKKSFTDLYCLLPIYQFRRLSMKFYNVTIQCQD